MTNTLILCEVIETERRLSELQETVDACMKTQVKFARLIKET